METNEQDIVPAVKPNFMDSVIKRIIIIYNIIREKISKLNPIQWVIIIMITLFLISLLFYTIHMDGKRRFVYLYPDYKTRMLVPEIDYLKNRATTAENIANYLDELILGPYKVDNTRIVSKETRILSVIYKKNRAVVHLSRELFYKDDKVYISLYTGLQTIVNNLLLNFKDIKTIDFYINGERLDPANVIASDQEELYSGKNKNSVNNGISGKDSPKLIYVNKFNWLLLQ